MSSSLMGSCSCLAMFLNSSKSMTPFSSLSNNEKTRLRPSFVLVSPTLEAMMSMNSSLPMGLFLSLRPLIKFKTKGFLRSNPSSSRTLFISTGSMVPLPSSSKTSKVWTSSQQSQGERRSFHAVGAVFAVLAEVVGALDVLAVTLLIISGWINNNFYYEANWYKAAGGAEKQRGIRERIHWKGCKDQLRQSSRKDLGCEDAKMLRFI